MKKLFGHLLALFFWTILSVRYRVKINGLEKLTPQYLTKSGGVLFLPNHPAAFVDPTLVTLALWPKFPIRPMVVEYMYFTPIVHGIMKFLNAIPVPNFDTSSNSLKRKRNEQVIQLVSHEIKKKSENFLIYPAGRLKNQSREEIGGASAVHQILQGAPEVNVVLVRIKGLWGSSFSRAHLGKTPPLFETIWHGVKVALKNLIFLTPKREVTIDFEPAPTDFPYQGSRLELNRYIEDWYNRPDGLVPQVEKRPGDSLILVSYSIWKESLLEIYTPKEEPDTEIVVENVTPDVQHKIFKKLSQLTELKVEDIRQEMNLSTDLGLDSLDISELASYLQTTFDVERVPAGELTTVKKVLGIAAKQVQVTSVIEEEKEKDTAKWFQSISRVRAQLAEGNTIPEVFLNNCQRMGSRVACADQRSGILTYAKLKLGVLILAEYIRGLPGEYIGILLPSSIGAFMTILATQLAGKIPLMINWTVGRRHLDSVVELTNVEVVLSSWIFLDRLDRVDLNGLDDKLVLLETVRQEFSLLDKLKAFWRSKQSTAAILKVFGHDQVKPDYPAVLLFTSGTESMPKGVPLSHANILSNQRSAFDIIEIFTDDVIFGILPPFHSFGFTVSGLMGLLSGVRIAYSPDPTDANQLAKGFKNWRITVMCGAPTFIKGLLKAGNAEQLKTMRLCVSGAEPVTPDLISMLDALGKKDALVEGYGITECSPILTANLQRKLRKGVGEPIPGVEICIVHPETLALMPTGAQGVILARGPNVFSGYLNPGLKSPFVTADGKQWYFTGDLGFLDEDGFLTISGRMKRFIKIGPEMVSLPAIEDCLLQTVPLMGWPLPKEGPALAIVGIEVPGEKTRIILFTTFPTTPAEINNVLYQAGFSNLVRIAEVIEVETVPIMGTGKTYYRLLEEKYLKAK